MFDDAIIFLRGAGKEAGHVNKGDDRNVKGIAEADEAPCLFRTVDIEHARQHQRLVGNDTHGASLDPAKADNDIARIARLQFKEIAFVDHLGDQFLDVIGNGRARGDQRIEAGLDTIPWIVGGPLGNAAAVVFRQQVKEIAHCEQRFDIILECIIGHARFGRMRHRTSQFFLRDDFVGDGLHNIGAGNEHVARILHHEDEVCHRWRIDGTTCARPHDHADLRHHTTGQHIALEHLGIAAERRHTFLDARTAAVVKADNRSADLHRHIHHLAHFLCKAFGKRTTEDGEILAEDIDQTAIDRAAAGDHTIAGDLLLLHAEVGAVMFDIHVDLFKAALIQQDRQAFACSQAAFGMLRIYALLPATQHRLRAALLHFGDICGHILPRKFNKACAQPDF